MHDNGPRLRVRAGQWAFTKEEGYGLASLLLDYDFIHDVLTSHRNGSITIYYDESEENKQKIFEILNSFTMDDLVEGEPTQTQISKEITDDFYLKLAKMIARRLLGRWFLPLPIKNALTIIRASKYIWEGLDSLTDFRIDVALLDGAAACRIQHPQIVRKEQPVEVDPKGVEINRRRYAYKGKEGDYKDTCPGKAFYQMNERILLSGYSDGSSVPQS